MKSTGRQPEALIVTGGLDGTVETFYIYIGHRRAGDIPVLACPVVTSPATIWRGRAEWAVT